MIIFLAVYNCIALPLDVSIVPPFMQENLHLETTNLMIDLIFFVDLILSFRTTYIDQMSGDEITCLTSIKWNYLFGRFTIDLMSTIPFDIIFKYYGTTILKE